VLICQLSFFQEKPGEDDLDLSLHALHEETDLDVGLELPINSTSHSHISNGRTDRQTISRGLTIRRFSDVEQGEHDDEMDDNNDSAHSATHLNNGHRASNNVP
jgi:hypothetical protein